MEPKFVTREPVRVVGIGAGFRHGDSRAIGKLWQEFLKKKDSVPGCTEAYAVGVCLEKHPGIELKDDQEMSYIAAVPVSGKASTPPNMVACELAGGKYAIFTHKGSVNDIQKTLGVIFGDWLPKNQSMHRDAPVFELYGERFNLNSPDSEVDIYVPVT